MKLAEIETLMKGAGKKIKINRENISRCMVTQPNLYIEFSQILVRQKAREKALRAVMDSREGYIHRLLQKKMSRPTTAMVMAKCWKDKKWQGARREIDEITTGVFALEQVCRALEHRRDMLINVGATVREEMRSLGVSTKKG